MLDHLKQPKPVGFEYVEPEKTVAEAHDAEFRWRNGWINDHRVSSYFWAVDHGDGNPIIMEYDPCTCGDGEKTSATAHRNHFIDIPGKWKPVLSYVAEFLDRDHNPIRVEQNIAAFAATETFDPFVFHGVPVTLDHQNLPPLEVKIEPGMSIVWGHRTITDLHSGGSHYAESQLFGRILADGTQEVTQVYPDGTTVTHASLNEAHEHMHSSIQNPRVK